MVFFFHLPIWVLQFWAWWAIVWIVIIILVIFSWTVNVNLNHHFFFEKLINRAPQNTAFFFKKKYKWKFCYCMFAIPTVNAQYRCQVLTWSCTHIHSKVSEFLMVMPSREVSIFSCVFSGKTLNNFIYVNSRL